MTDKDRDFAMEIALAAEGDHIWREWPKGRLTQSRIFRLANLIRPIIEEAQAAEREKVLAEVAGIMGEPQPEVFVATTTGETP